MTDKEKAWAYDGALNRAKAAIDNAADKDLVKGIVTTIFPRLREGQENDVIDIPFGAKDSELKGWEYTIPEGMEAIIKDGKVIVREKESEDERIIEEIKFAVLQMKTTREDTRQRCLTWLEKQKEQNPAEWSEDIIRKAVKEVGLTQYQIDWFKTNVFPPKQEWSEEEMKVLDSIIDDYEKAAKSFCGYDGKIGLLKAIRDGEYNLPNPAEWSEEDEKILDSLIRLYSIEYSEYVCPWANGDITYGDVVNFLKSLRPSWKPSEEQMEAFETAERWYSDNMGCNPALYQLLCGLKKL